MKSGNTFTKKDLIVVCCCLVFFAMNIGAVGRAGREQAKQVVCTSNLKKWGNMFQMYLADHNNTFMAGKSSTTPDDDKWFFALAPYYGCVPREYNKGIPREYKIRFCPSAMRFSNDHSSAPIHPEGAQQPFAAWETGLPVDHTQLFSLFHWDGSYGSNSWFYNASNSVAPGIVGNWRNPNVANAGRIPVLVDSASFGGRPEASPQIPYEQPPYYSGDIVGAGSRGGFMKQFCIDRHNGTVNTLFMDWSVRPVGLKELWTLPWHRSYNTCNKMTMCGNNGNPVVWPEWMKNFKDY